MNPNNNQPTSVNPVQQPAAQAVPAVTNPQPVIPVAPQSTNNPKKSLGKRTILLVILILIIVGIVVYALFTNNQMNSNQKTIIESNTSVVPSPSVIPTLAPQNDLEVVNPEADLLDLETDIQGL